jgi:hypothetical protein
MFSHSRKAFISLRNASVRSRFFTTSAEQNQEINLLKEKLQRCEDKITKLEETVQSHERANTFIRTFVLTIATTYAWQTYDDNKSRKRAREASAEKLEQMVSTHRP